MSDTTVSNDVTLSRSPGLGMEPKSILIGDRLRHTVHDGALKMPARALQLIKQHSVPLEPTDEVIELPSVDFIIRPTLDKSPITATYLREDKGFMMPSGEEDVPPISTIRTVAVNQIWTPAILTPDADRLRGGGLDEETLDMNMSDVDPSREAPIEAVVADAPADVGAVQPPNDSPLVETLAEPAPAVESTSSPPVDVEAKPAPISSASTTPSESLIKQPTGSTQPTPMSLPPVEVQAQPALATSPGAAPAESLIKQPPSLTQPPPTSLPPVEVKTEPTPAISTGEAPAESLITLAPGLIQPAPTSLPPVEVQAEAAPATSTHAVRAEPLIKQPPSLTQPIAQTSVPPVELKTDAAPATSIGAESLINHPAGLTQPAPPTTQVAPPQVVSSSSPPATAKPATPTAPSPQPVVTLSKIPPPQYAQHIPGPNDEMQVEIKNARAPWYKKDNISDIERTLLPEWFDCSAQHRTPDSYIKARDQILQMSTQLGNRFITNTLIRRTIPGDAGSLNRLFHFLLSYGFINADAINDSTPTSAALRDSKKRSLPTKFEDKLANVILKRHKADSGTINWQVVADEIGDGATAADCRKGFLSLDLDAVHPTASTERSITPDPSDKPEGRYNRTHGLNMEDLLVNTDDTVVKATVENALQQTGDLVQARKAAMIALLASQAAQKAIAEEDALAHVLAELNEKRMQRLEKRIELLNDVEGMMEAERMALELERRDLYTARCRHWFGGSS
jgi:SWIRM domain